MSVIDALLPPRRRLLSTTVQAVTCLTPRMRRITLSGESLIGFPVTEPAQWVKLFVPVPTGGPPIGRAYTIRRFREFLAELEIDMALHGDGPAGSWAARAEPGHRVDIAGPRRGFRLSPDTRHLLLAGDETALPAIGAILETLPAGLPVDVVAEVANEAEEQDIETRADARIEWLHRRDTATPPGALLQRALTQAPLPGPGWQVWLAGESVAVQSLRRHFLETGGMVRGLLHAAGYWKNGEADHRDRDGDQ